MQTVEIDATSELTPELVQAELKDFFNALANANQDAGLAFQWMQNIREFCQKNPELAGDIFSANNLKKVNDLKNKYAAGKEPNPTDFIAFVPDEFQSKISGILPIIKAMM